MVSKYEQLVPVLFGDGAIEQLGEKVKEFGCKKVLCVFDEGVKAAGIFPKVETILKSAGVHCAVFDKIQADPSEELVNECAQFARDEKVDCFLAIGGGSSMDCTKAASLLMDRPLPLSQYITDPPVFYSHSNPVILVPTTSGTGSECTHVAVITYKGTKTGVFLRSNLAIVDPQLTYTVPPTVTANTGLDAFCHAAEAVTANDWNPHSELLGLHAIGLIAKYLPTAVKDGRNAEARHNLSLASNFAGIAFADTGCHLGHCLADGLSANFHTPHGYNCIVCDAEMLAACAVGTPEKVKLVGEAMGIRFTGKETPQELGTKVAEEVRKLMRACNVKSLKASGFTREQLVGCTDMCMKLNLGLQTLSPVPVTSKLVSDIYAKSFENYQ